MPACREELIRRFRQIGCGTAQFLRIVEHDDGAGVEHVRHRLHIGDQRRHQRLHSLHGNRVGDGFQHVFGIGNRSDQAFRASAHRVGKLQFTAGRGPDGIDTIAICTLV